MGSLGCATQVTHVVCVPFPSQGHISPMLKLAKLLHSKGIHITFVNTEFNHKRLIKSRGNDSVKGLSDFQFHTIPDGLPPTDVESTQDIPSLAVSTKKNCGVPFQNLLTKLNETSDIPHVSCVVSDGCMSFTLAVAKEFGFPVYLFWTISACGFMAYLHYRHLLEKGLIPLKDESCLTNGYLETVVDFVPGFNNIRLMDFPAFARTTDPKDKMIDHILGETENATNGSGII
ncbi:7-deoxyloganetin glucosyltransferase-like isoform X2 [Papaver somniferum]|uniref:7-deoxyloganetin glucosyltransferase-like isoform X2 n=1 Tax=Papaver somniferum TaxID=3469 RepID=UPI000E6FA3F6|nr:7-deoxyloganetin glucosyltransferase-like isoform X2 [Papaver somniferum]